MSRQIDERVVSMQFDNQQFESNVKTSISTLDKLKESLNLSESAKNLEQVNTAARNFDTSHLNDSIETVKTQFSSLQVIGVTALSNLTTAAMNACKKIANALTSSLTRGGWNRAMNIEQAKFQLEGLGYTWNDVAEDIDYAVKGTAYGLDAAAKACSQLVASNVQIGDDMKMALRGISGVAAMTNSSYEDISRIFTTVAGQGRLMSQNLLSISTRGINAAATLAKHLGTTESQIREMVSDGEIDFATFAEAMDAAFGEHAKDANKTFTGAMSNTKAALSRIGADVAGPALINLRDIFNGLRVTIDDTHEALKPFLDILNNTQNAVTKMAVKFIDLGGLKSILSGIGNIFKGIWSAIEPIKDAFVDIFPMGTVEQLVEITKQFGEITKKFKLSEENSAKLKDTFKGLFAVLAMVVDGVKALGKGIIRFLGNFKGLGGKILSATAALGKFLLKMRDGMAAAEVFRKIVDAINDVLDKLIDKLKAFKNYLVEKFDLQGFEGISGIFKGILKIVTTLASKLVDLGKSFMDNLSNDKVQAAMGIAGALLLMREASLKYIAVAYPIKRVIAIIKDLLAGAKDFLGLGNYIKGAFSALNSSLWSLNRTLKYEQLMNYAKALAILAGSMLLISLIDTDKLAASLGVITVLIAELMGIMAILDKMSRNPFGGKGIKGFLTGFGESIMDIARASEMTTSLIKISVALFILAGSLKLLGSMDLDDLAKGFGGVTALMILLVAAAKILATDGSKVIQGSGHMLVMAIALTTLTGALKIIASMSWPELGRGVVGLLSITAILVAAARLMQSEYKTITKFAGQMFTMAISLTILAGVLKIIASMSWTELGKGLATIAAAMVIFGVALKAMSSIKGSLVSTASSILIMSVSIIALASAFKAISSMSVGSIVKSLVTVAGSLVIFGLAAYVLTKIGAAQSLLMIAGAIALLGIGVLALGAGLTIVAAGIFALVEALTAGAASIVVGLTVIIVGIIDLIPAIIVALAQGLRMILLSIVDVLVECIPSVVKGIFTFIMGVLTSLVKYTPKIVGAIFDFLINIINTLAVKMPDLIVAVVNLLTGVFQGAIDALKTMDPKVLANGLASVGLLSALVAALAATAYLTPMAMIGVLGMAAIISELSLVLAAIGAFSQIPGLQWLITEGGYFLQAVGTAVGQFLGGIIGGFSQGMSASLPKIGNDMSKFMKNILPFIVGVKMVDKNALKGTFTLVDIIDELSHANTDELLLTELGKELSEFAPYLVEYAGTIKDLDTKAIEASANAATLLTTLANELPDSGGAISWFKGDNTLEEFGESLTKFAPNLVEYADTIKDLDSESIDKSIKVISSLTKLASELPEGDGKNLKSFKKHIIPFGEAIKIYSEEVADVDSEAITNSAKATKALADVANTIPTTGGLVSLFVGNNSISKFGEELTSLGTNLKDFSDAVSEGDGINSEGVESAANAIKSLAGASNSIPNTGGLISLLTGENSIVNFGYELSSLGMSLKDFSDKVSEGDGINIEAITSAANATKVLAETANSIPNTGGLISLLTGENSIVNFGYELSSLGMSLKDFSDKVSEGDGINTEKIAVAANAAKILAEMTADIPNTGGLVSLFAGEYDLTTFSSELTALGKGLKGFSDAVSEGDGINVTQITAAADTAKALGEMVSNISDKTGINLGSFGVNLVTFGGDLKEYFKNTGEIKTESITASTKATDAVMNFVNTIDAAKVKEAAKSLTDMVKAIKGASDIKDGATTGFVNTISKLGTVAIDALLETFKDSATELNDAGISAIEEFIAGIKDGLKTAKEDCSTSAINCANAMDSFDVINEFKSAGREAVEGFAEGINKNTWRAEAKAKAMAKAAAAAAKNELDINSPSRVFMAIGSCVPEGFAKGISKYSGMVSEPISEMSNSAVNGVGKAISRISDLVNSNIDAQPTIRPVLDLSDVTSGAEAINGIFGMQPSVGVLSNVTSISASMNRRQNGANSEVISAIKDLKKSMAVNPGNTYQINGITYDDGSSISEAVQALVRAAKVERRI